MTRRYAGKRRGTSYYTARAATRPRSAKQPAPAEASEQPPAPIEFASDKDFQFAQALNHLKGLPVQTAQGPQAADPKAEPSKKN